MGNRAHFVRITVRAINALTRLCGEFYFLLTSLVRFGAHVLKALYDIIELFIYLRLALFELFNFFEQKIYLFFQKKHPLYLKYLLSRPSNALPWRASSFAIS